MQKHDTQGDPKNGGDEKKPHMPGQPGGDEKKDEKGVNSPRPNDMSRNKGV